MAQNRPWATALDARCFPPASVHAGLRGDAARQIRLADEIGDRTMRCVARATIVNPLHFAGNLREALATAAEALELCAGDPRIGIKTVGFSPSSP